MKAFKTCVCVSAQMHDWSLRYVVLQASSLLKLAPQSHKCHEIIGAYFIWFANKLSVKISAIALWFRSLLDDITYDKAL